MADPIVPAPALPPTAEVFPPGHIFDPTTVESSITKALAAIPAGDNWAVIGHAEANSGDPKSVDLAFVARKQLSDSISSQWELKTSWLFPGGHTIEAQVVISGK